MGPSAVQCVTKSCWRNLLSDEFSLGNIYIYEIIDIAKERVHLHQQLKPIKLPDTSQGHYTMQIGNKNAC